MMTKDFMQQFVSDDELLPIRHIIFPVDGYRIATDSKHMLMVSESECTFPLDYDPAIHGKPLNALSVFQPDNVRVTHRLRLADLLTYIGSISTEDEMDEVEVPTEFKECDCDECDDGKITLTTNVRWGDHDYDLEDEVDCPVCHGLGKIPVDPNYDPDECDDEDDVENWKTYECRPTGRKVIGYDTLCHAGTLLIRARYLYYLQKIMDYLDVDSLDFAYIKQMVVFKTPTLCYAICGMSADADLRDYTIADHPLPITAL